MRGVVDRAFSNGMSLLAAFCSFHDRKCNFEVRSMKAKASIHLQRILEKRRTPEGT
jgi:hypothetical protein